MSVGDSTKEVYMTADSCTEDETLVAFRRIELCSWRDRTFTTCQLVQLVIVIY